MATSLARALAFTLFSVTMAMAQRPQGPCDIYASAQNRCVAAHSTTRALYTAYHGPLYQVLRQSDGKTLDIGVVTSGGYADSAAQDKFCATTTCWISIIYDQSPNHNDLTQAPNGGFGGPAMGGFNNLPIADMAPVSLKGHKVYGVFIEPGMGLRHNDAKGTAVDDQAEGQYWVVNGKHYNSGCCFDYGNAEIDSRDDDNGTMETLYFGNARPWYSGQGDGPWIMTDQENNLVGCINTDGSKGCPNLPSMPFRFVTAMAKGEPHRWATLGGNAQNGPLSLIFEGPRVNPTYDPMRKQGAILLGNGGDNSDGSQGTFYEGAMTAAGTYPSTATDQLVQANIVAAGYAELTDKTPALKPAGPIRINEFRVSSGAFIELYNAGSQTINISNWTVTVHPAEQAIFSEIKIPAETNLKAGGFYLLGLANSGLAAPARTGDTTVYLRNTEGMSMGDTVTIGSGSDLETRKIASLGSAATNHTTVWQPLPEGPVITLPAGSTNVPVENTSGFTPGEKIALGHGAAYPVAANPIEQYEIATVTTVGKPGTQAYLALDAPAGTTNLKVTSLSDISIGDKIRLDIDSLGHGIETVTVTNIGTVAHQTNLSAPANPGASRISVRSAQGFSAGDKITVGTPATLETVTVSAVGAQTLAGADLDIRPGLSKAHVSNEWVVSPGTGLDLEAPLRFQHAANLPFGNRGTGITFEPATAFPHSSNEPVQALGTGITFDTPLKNNHPIDAPIRDNAVTTAGYQGKPEPNQWFGGPELTTIFPHFGQTINVEEGSILLRNASGEVTESLNYGGLVDPWAARGDQAASGARLSGCYVTAPGSVFDPWSTVVTPVPTNSSAGRFPDGADTGSNCNDFRTQAVATLSAASAEGATNIKVTSTENFRPGRKITIGGERATISAVGTAGAATLSNASGAGETILKVANVTGFRRGQAVSIGEGPGAEIATIAATRTRNGATITFVAPLTHPHANGDPIAGEGINLTAPLAHTHPIGTQVSDDLPTPGAPNQYQAKTN